MISLNILPWATPLNDQSASEVPAHDSNFGYKAVFNAVVEHFLKPEESLGVVQPDRVGQENEVGI